MLRSSDALGGDIRFNLLGPLEIFGSGGPVALAGIRQRATLGYLLLNANRTVAASRLMRALWPGEAPPTARKMLHNAVSAVRGALAGARDEAVLLTHAPGYLLRVEPAAVDLSEFNRLVAVGRDKLRTGAPDNASRFLRQALDLCRGPVLADLAEAGINWPELAAVENERLTVLEDYVDAELACGRHDAVLRELEEAAAVGPPRERLCRQLMLALYRSGRQADALDVYRRTRAMLIDQLGLEPSHELRELERAILDHDPSLASPVIPQLETPERKRITIVLAVAQLDPNGDEDEAARAVTAALREARGRLTG